MNPRVFREYDIRGNADRDLDDGFAADLGRAIGTHLHRAGARRITLGRDCRLHSPRLHAKLFRTSARLPKESTNSSSRFRPGFSPSVVRKSVQREVRFPATCFIMTAMEFVFASRAA